MDNKKGVISRISPDEDMPRDQFGNVAHLVVDPISVSSRLNPARFWKGGLNYISSFIRRRVIELAKTDVDAAFEMLVEWFHDVRPNYAQMTRSVYSTRKGKEKLLRSVEEDFIKLHIPPFYVGLSLDKIKYLREKWEIPLSPVTFTVFDENGVGQPVTTENNVVIGREHILLLEKIPHAHAPGFARVAHQGYPVKPSNEAKLRTTVATSPIKKGEDEYRFIGADSGMRVLSRFTDLQGNSPVVGVKKLGRELMMNERPTQINRIDVSDHELSMGNTIRGTFHHETSILGIDTRQTRVTAYDMQFLTEEETDDLIFVPPAEDTDIADFDPSNA